MEVKLISCTPSALELLIYTKNTRLQGEQTLYQIQRWPMEKKMAELNYMKDTIKSSWEFVDYVFEITGVSRAFTHQFVRTRNGSYAQQSQRTVNAQDSDWVVPSDNKYSPRLENDYNEVINNSMNGYADLIEAGMEIQDARGVLPTNIETSIIAKFNLRTLNQMAEVRLCTKTQGEYQTVFRAMKAEVVNVHPWAEDMIQVFCANHGSCCFPRFEKCPIYSFTYNFRTDIAHDTIRSNIRREHDALQHEKLSEANPVAKDGRTDA